MPIKVTLSNALKAWEEEHSRALTAKSLASALQVEESAVQGLLDRTAKEIDFELLDRLCTALDCTPNDLLRHTADPDMQEAITERLGGDLGTSIAA